MVSAADGRQSNQLVADSVRVEPSVPVDERSRVDTPRIKVLKVRTVPFGTAYESLEVLRVYKTPTGWVVEVA
jgi:hypothetical protein